MGTLLPIHAVFMEDKDNTFDLQIMTKYTNTPLTRFRTVALLEGLSFLLLLFIAMPLKYWAGIPEVVKYVGWAHGVLFVLYIFALLETGLKLRWSFLTMVLAFLASLLPFGTFVLDAQLLKKQQVS